MSVQLGGAVVTGVVVIALAWMIVLRGTDRAQRRRGIGTLIVGLLAGLPVGGIMLVLTLGTPELLGPLQTALYGGFVSSALPAELAKLVILALIARRAARGRTHRGFDTFDGVRLGAAVALGLAAVESAFYLAVEGGWASTVLRAFPGVLIQTATGAMIGVAFALRGVRSAERSGVWPAWIQAVLLHGAYSFAVLGMIEVSYLQMVTSSNLTPIIAVLFVVLLIAALIASYQLWRVFRLARSD